MRCLHAAYRPTTLRPGCILSHVSFPFFFCLVCLTLTPYPFLEGLGAGRGTIPAIELEPKNRNRWLGCVFGWPVGCCFLFLLHFRSPHLARHSTIKNADDHQGPASRSPIDLKSNGQRNIYIISRQHTHILHRVPQEAPQVVQRKRGKRYRKFMI